MGKIIKLALMESLHKRLAYLKGKKIKRLTEFPKKEKRSPQTLINAARRQTIPAFREKGVWMMGE
jgi:hypothetical protein